MASDELSQRVNRIYAALEGVREQDLAKFPPKIIDEADVTIVWQDFRGGMTDAELSNAAHSLIHNIAHLPDHLRRWAVHNGQDKSKVDATFAGSRALKIVKDLSNNDKHGYPPRNGGHSAVSPHITEIQRVLRSTTKPEAGSSVVVIMTLQGPKQVSGSGTTDVIMTGDVVDANGNTIGDLYEFEMEALTAIELLLKDFGIQLRANGA